MSPRSERLLLLMAALIVTAFAVSFLIGQADRQPKQAPATAAQPAPPVPEPPTPRGRIEILNAGDRLGLAERLADRLRAQGYDVAHWGNAGASVPDRSVIVTRRGDGSIAGALAELLGIDSLRSALEPGLGIDATVIVGSAFDEEGGDS